MLSDCGQLGHSKNRIYFSIIMIETSLFKLDEAVQDGSKLFTGSKVVLPTGDEADIFGFIAIEDNLLSVVIDMPPLGECQIFSNRVIFYIDNRLYRFPIFQSVCKASEERYGIYMLYVPKFLNLSSEWERKWYCESMCNEKPHLKVSRINDIRIEENIAYYYPNNHDLFFESRSKLRGIGTGFAVITRRISKLSDDIKYEIFDSHSVIIDRNDKM